MFEQTVKRATMSIREIMKSGEQFRTLKKIQEEIQKESHGHRM